MTFLSWFINAAPLFIIDLQHFNSERCEALAETD
jgi:hypothetical protein